MKRTLVALTRPSAVRWIGVTAVVTTGLTVYLALWVTPSAKVQGTLVRLLYLHPPVAWVALYCSFGLAALSSLLYLWRRTRTLLWDRLAAASVEVGVIFTALTLLTGSLWGRPTWGVWWTWTARLTSTALLLVLYLGYLALRRVPADHEVRARRCAVAALVAFVDVPIVTFSVDWWQTLHQKGTVLNPGLTIKVHGSMAWTLGLGFVALTLVFVWMVMVRYRIEVLSDAVGNEELEVSLTERRAEGTTGTSVGSSVGSGAGHGSGHAGEVDADAGADENGPAHEAPVIIGSPGTGRVPEPSGGPR